jgi:hypothetical protein
MDHIDLVGLAGLIVGLIAPPTSRHLQILQLVFPRVLFDFEHDFVRQHAQLGVGRFPNPLNQSSDLFL